ncbi:MAG: hypothetical protein JST16_11445 [Bdellovibrionales bacterium]|nr:hypothetical protein [Bdellovibrionales bacterium]
MSHLVAELGQIIDRVVIVAPSLDRLKELFEALSFELTSDLGAGQKLHLAAAKFPEGSVRYWNSFTLGQRAGLDMRVAAMGVLLEDLLDHPQILDLGDSFFFWMSPQEADSRAWLRLKVAGEARLKPVNLVGLPGQDSLEELALVEWAQRHFEQVRRVTNSERFLAEGLEWALSF